MKSLSWVCLLSLASSFVVAQDTSIGQVAKAFDDAHVPKDLFITFKPSAILQASFPLGFGQSIILTAGSQLPRNLTAGSPSFQFLGSTAERGPFVLAAVDPDAPTPQNPTSAQIRHFLGGNFYLTDRAELKRPLLNRTAAISEYRQPNPPAGSPAHRYIFLLYRQPDGFNEQTLVTPTTPVTQFNISRFASDVELGDPIAGTFMVVAPAS